MLMQLFCVVVFFFSSIRRHTRGALVTGVQTWALPILLPGLVDALARNAARQQARVRVFEIGKVFEDRESEEGPAPLETLRVAAAASGEVADAQWGEPSRAVDFHDLKGDLESVAALSGASLDYRPSQAVWGHPGRSADVFRD